MNANVVATYTITGRGVVLALDRLLDLRQPSVNVRITRPDGTTIDSTGHPEFLCWSASPLRETTAIVVSSVSKDDVPPGSAVEIE